MITALFSEVDVEKIFLEAYRCYERLTVALLQRRVTRSDIKPLQHIKLGETVLCSKIITQALINAIERGSRIHGRCTMVGRSVKTLRYPTRKYLLEKVMSLVIVYPFWYYSFH